MPDRAINFQILGAALFALAVLPAIPDASAQKIVCWKDKSGKVVGCGDRVPPEYRENEAKVLDRRGLTRGTVVSAEEEARLKQEEEKKAALKAEEKRRIAEQRRQDSALLNTYTSTREIDQRRDRELQVVDLQITQLKALLSRATKARANDDKTRIEANILAKEKDKARITASYDRQKARFLELKGAPTDTTGSSAIK